MKIIAIGDLHIKMVPGVCRGWQSARYKQFINNIVKICAKEKAILAICGDTLDSVCPKKEEISLFMYLMHELAKSKIKTLLVSGNHETTKKGESILDFMEVNQFDNVVYREHFDCEGIRFHLCNHDSIEGFEPVLGKGLNVLISHFRCNYNEFVKEEIPVEEFCKPYDLCVVGDIHDSFNLGKVVYTNNPVNKEFDSNPSCGYLEIGIVNGNLGYINRKKTSYPMLVGKKIKASDMSELKLDPKNFYRIEVEGTAEELKAMPDTLKNALIVKVPIVESVLAMPEVEAFSAELKSDDELVDYMKSLKYENSLIADMMDELRRDA